MKSTSVTSTAVSVNGKTSSWSTVTTTDGDSTTVKTSAGRQAGGTRHEDVPPEVADMLARLGIRFPAP